MSSEGYDLFDLLYLLDAVWNLDYLEGKFVEAVFDLVVVEADIDLAVGAFSKHELICLRVVVAEELFGVLIGDALAVDDFMVWVVYDFLIGLDLALAMLEDVGEWLG